nr:hypothetical protein CFP56_52893 [Quercus suber]
MWGGSLRHKLSTTNVAQARRVREGKKNNDIVIRGEVSASPTPYGRFCLSRKIREKRDRRRGKDWKGVEFLRGRSGEVDADDAWKSREEETV